MSDLSRKISIFVSLAAFKPGYGREYMKKRYHQKRQELIDKLGGKCVRCSKTNDLHLDHINKKKKSIRMSDIHSVADAKVQKEIKNIQILCKDCHKDKTKEAWDFSTSKPKHGTYWMYRKHNCRCNKCAKAYKEARARWRKPSA